MKRLRLYLVVGLVGAAFGGALGQEWEGPFTTLNSTDELQIMYENENTSGNTIIVGVDVTLQTRHWIYGSDETPPWTAKFTPKVNLFFPAHYGVRGISIPNGYEHFVTHGFTRETGTEQWTRAFPEYVEVATRNRLWDTPAPGEIIAVTRPIQ